MSNQEDRSVAGLMQQVREFVNLTHRQHALIESGLNWHMVCSSMDVIEDAELAVSAYVNNEFPDDDGDKYLRVYGVLQALFVQQDALSNLCLSLRIEYVPAPELKSVREIRNDSLGHPTNRRSGPTQSFHSMSRITIRKSGFQMLSQFADRHDSEFRDIDVLGLIQIQSQSVCAALERVVASLRAEEERYRAMHRQNRLQDVFPPTIDYYFEKMSEATYGDRGKKYGAAHFDLVTGILGSLKQQLADRGILDAGTGIDDVLKQLEYPMGELRFFFKEEGQRSLTDKAAYIFVYYVHRKFEELAQMAREVDEETDASPSTT